MVSAVCVVSEVSRFEFTFARGREAELVMAANGVGEAVTPRSDVVTPRPQPPRPFITHALRRGSLLDMGVANNGVANVNGTDDISESERSTPRSQVSFKELEGTRLLWIPLFVPQWVCPGSARSVSHAAVLFDIAYAAALSHHAYVLVHVRANFTAWYSVVIYLVTAIPTIWQWWAISLFLCRFDPGDLCNEFILVVYMVLVLGQSMSIQPCADCIISANLENPCELQQGSTSM